MQSCDRPWSVCEVVLVPFVDVVVAVMSILLFVLDVGMLRECEGNRNACVGDGGGLVGVSAVHKYVGSTRGSGIVSCAANLLVESVVSGMK